MKSCWVVGALALCAVSVSAQVPAAKVAIATDDDYSQAMKEVAAQNGVLRKTLPSSLDDAAAAAVRLETVFKDVQAYWENRKVEDATTAAKTAVAASKAISQALAARDIAGATAASQQLAGTCMACHAAHRERLTYDFYRIK